MASQELPTAIGRYEVVSRLGQGGMGSLYLAKDPKIGRLVAIKLVRQEFDSPEARQRFAREAQSAGTLRHSNIVTIFDVDDHDGLPFIAMEYIDGETLAEVVKRKALLPIGRRLQWLEDLCAGLAYAHRQGVIHRDIKPANLMVDSEGTLKILDFGLARRDASKFTQSHVIIGTPNYMSPEQIRGQNLDPRSDIFAVGALMYELLTYHEAFPGAVHQTMHRILHEEPEPVENHVSGLDPAIAKILGRALVKDRDGRYADLSAMKNDLAEVRIRMESVETTDQATIPLSKDARFGGPSATPIRGTTPMPTPGARSGSSQSSKRDQTNRQSLHRRRAEQIGVLLDEARRIFDAGELDKARDKCDEMLMFDPDHPGGLQLMDDIAAETDRQQVAQWIAEARAELQKGQLDRSEALVAQARQLQPDAGDVQQLQEAIDTTRREIERTRQAQETMRRARARFAESSFDAAIRAASEVLAIDPENVAAKDLQARAQEAIEAQSTRVARDKSAQSAVASARKMFESGDAAGAIAQLEAFEPKHDLVSGFLATLKGEEPFRGSRGETPDLPARRNMLVAVGVFSVVLVAATLVYRPWESAAPPSLNESPAAADIASTPVITTPAVPMATPPPAAVAPPPAAVAPPVAATDPNGPDLTRAYDAVRNGRLSDAERLMAAIRTRDPKYPGVANLQAAITTQREFEEKRRVSEEANAAEAKRLADAMAAAPPPRDPVSPTINADTPIPTVAPASGLTAPSAPPTPQPRGEVERPAIERAIQQWADAFTKRDVNALSEIRALSEAEANRWRNTFRGMATFKMNVSIMGNPEVIDNDAVVPVQETAQYTRGKGQPLLSLQTSNINYRLRKISGQWRMIRPDEPMPKAGSK